MSICRMAEDSNFYCYGIDDNTWVVEGPKGYDGVFTFFGMIDLLLRAKNKGLAVPERAFTSAAKHYIEGAY